MQLFRTVSEVAEFRQRLRDKGKVLGLVPTMGALHQGHISLVQRALSENDAVMVTIFVNPTQFNNSEDLEKYPRTLDIDLEKLNSLTATLSVFAPDANEIYDGKVNAETYDFSGLDRVMEGAFRPGHFDGVGTIVERLFRCIEPNRAYFGEKDYQQLQIIKNLVNQRELPVEVIACPIVREANGLAMSSRNARLTASQRQKAAAIFRTLSLAKQHFSTSNSTEIGKSCLDEITNDVDFNLEYFQISEADSLQPAMEKLPGKKYRAFIAVHLGGVRLIDNIALN
jgi:pantoate--beta-alanine ligase